MRIYNFQKPRTTRTDGLKKWLFQAVDEDPGKTVNFWRVKRVVSFSTLKMRKSKKNEHLYTHTLTCMRENVMVSQLGLNRVKTSAWTSCNPLRVFFAVPIAFGPPEQYFFMIFVDTRWQNISLWFCPWLFPLWFYPRRAIMETLYLHVNYMCLIYKWQIPFVAMKLLFVSCI